MGGTVPNGEVYPHRVATDDEIIRAYEEELGPEPPGRSNRGFWVVLGTMVFGGLFLVVEIFANRPLANDIGHAQDTLRRARSAAGSIYDRTGSFVSAGPDDLADDLTGLSLRPGNEPSVGLDDVSVSASEMVWAAAVRSRPGACFYVRLGAGSEPRYGSGSVCTGEAALEADQPRW
jgi:hypothetical protein